jgi:hypothetical protein
MALGFTENNDIAGSGGLHAVKTDSWGLVGSAISSTTPRYSMPSLPRDDHPITISPGSNDRHREERCVHTCANHIGPQN